MRLSLIATYSLVALSLGIAAPCATADGQFGSLRRDNMGFEIRPLAGSFLPTGDAKKSLASAALGGLQMSLSTSRHFALTVTVTAAPTTDPTIAGRPGVDIVMYDLGAEWRLGGGRRGGNPVVTSFVGAGFGSLAYEYSDSSSSSVSNRDGYVALGGELGVGVIGIRLEGRNYLSHVSALASPMTRKTRQNDVTVSLGLAFRLGRSGSQEPETRPRVLTSR